MLSFALAVERLLVTLQNSVVCRESFVSREVSTSQEERLNNCACTYASDCHIFLMAFKPGDQMSIKYDIRVGF